MNKTALETSNVIGYSAAICRILLHHYKWNKETLLERYVWQLLTRTHVFHFRFCEAGDIDAFFKSVNLIDPKKGKRRSNVSGQCKICYERKTLSGLACGHVFCYECWDHYLVNKVVFPLSSLYSAALFFR